jgi:hypothetical protein
MIQEHKKVTFLSNPALEISLEAAGMKAGLVTCGLLITYFMIMNYFNLLDSAIAWGMNFIILLAGIVFSYRYYRTKTKLNVEYIPGLIIGAVTTVTCVVPFVLFIYIYFSQVNMPPLLLKKNVLFMGEQISPGKAAASTMVEGICSGVIISFMLMQYFQSGFRKARKEISIHG